MAFIVVLLVFPLVVVLAVHRWRWANRVGAVLLCYAAGLVAGNSPLVPAGVEAAQTGVSEASIALALPLLLFSLDVRAWLGLAGRALLSLLLAVAAVVTVAVGLWVLFRPVLTGADQLAGMAVGVYTGGTPNLAAIKTGLGIAEERYLLFHTFDTLVGAAYLLFMVAAGKAVFARWLRPAPVVTGARDATAVRPEEDFRPLLRPGAWRGTALAVGLSAALVGLALLLAGWLAPGGNAALVILLITSGGLAAALVPAVRRLTTAYQAGMYLIYVFSFTVATQADVSALAAVDLALVGFIALAVFASLALHALFCRLLGVDVDTFMVTSVACVCSPPFVPLIARRLGDPTLILSGFTTGIIGYALGNYLGIGLGLLLAQFS